MIALIVVLIVIAILAIARNCSLQQPHTVTQPCRQCLVTDRCAAATPLGLDPQSCRNREGIRFA